MHFSVALACLALVHQTIGAPVLLPAGALPAGALPAGAPLAGAPLAGALPTVAPPAGKLPAGAPLAGALPTVAPPAGKLPAGAPANPASLGTVKTTEPGALGTTASSVLGTPPTKKPASTLPNTQALPPSNLDPANAKKATVTTQNAPGAPAAKPLGMPNNLATVGPLGSPLTGPNGNPGSNGAGQYGTSPDELDPYYDEELPGDFDVGAPAYIKRRSPWA